MKLCDGCKMEITTEVIKKYLVVAYNWNKRGGEDNGISTEPSLHINIVISSNGDLCEECQLKALALVSSPSALEKQQHTTSLINLSQLPKPK